MLLPKLHSSPFQFLLYTEWVMLASCMGMAVFEAWEKQTIPVQHIVILVLLGIMGVMLPTGRPAIKYVYTAIEMSLIFFGTVLGYLHILPTLYVIVMIRSCFLFQPIGRWIVAGVSFVLFSVHQIQYVKTFLPLGLPNAHLQRIWMHQIAEYLMFGLVIFLVSQLVNTLLAERKAQQQLSLAHEQLQQYALQIEDLAAVQERNRIAREIHDALGHALTNLNIQLQTVAKLWQHDQNQARVFLDHAQQLGKLAIQEVRQSVRALRADAHEEPALDSAIASLMEDFRQSTGISVANSIQIEAMLPPQVVKTLYRIVQEALTNICKYAQATQVRLELRATPDGVHLTIEDNGHGFCLESHSPGFGLQGMRERVAALNGEFWLKAAPGSGCHITVSLPLKNGFATQMPNDCFETPEIA
ncbi:sensor histidine kinase [Oscillatoria sp. FACHB-1407]|uniref:sensor histidine kinase n=1 Tax=Oscillatoria sp. FACHB-1407 TaxID=2692847 RepID=UPI00168396CF|nr:sensor histidine kinase [Oscillatoria sp. FACHB-1407]MBD2463599.1 sensor histidine kinase [Oscillatoria sp. FACHB-1407]